MSWEKPRHSNKTLPWRRYCRGLCPAKIVQPAQPLRKPGHLNPQSLSRVGLTHLPSLLGPGLQFFLIWRLPPIAADGLRRLDPARGVGIALMIANYGGMQGNGCIYKGAQALAVALAVVVGLAGALPAAAAHAHAHPDQTSPVAATDGSISGPEAPEDHGRRHPGNGCHGALCWSLIAKPVVLVAVSRLSTARPTSGLGPLPSGPDLQGEPPVPKHG